MQYKRSKALGKLNSTLTRVALYGVLVIGAVVFLFPFFQMIMSSFKETSEIFTLNQKLLPERGIRADKYIALFKAVPFGRHMLNSMIHSVGGTALVLFFASLAGFAFAKYPFPGRNFLFAMILLTMMVPLQVRLVPSFILIRSFGWLDTFWALIIPGAAEAFGIFLMRQYMKAAIPNELMDAAYIDGCRDFQIYRKVALPMVVPGLVMLGLMVFLQRWNSFLWPFVVISKEEMMTATLVLPRLADPNQEPDYGMIFAGLTLSAMPTVLLFLAFQKRFISGLTSGYLKG